MAKDRQIAPRRDGLGKWKDQGAAGTIVPKERDHILLHRLREQITLDDWDAVVKKALEQAKDGDRFARKWLSDLAIGPPAQVHEHLSVAQQHVTVEVVYDERKPQTGDVQVSVGETIDAEGYEKLD